MDGDDAIYSIGSAARMVGVPAATLRNWEKRYGIPRAGHKSSGGQRIYTASEVALATVLAGRAAAGVPVGKAAARLSAVRNAPGLLGAAFQQAAEGSDVEAMHELLEEAAALYPPMQVWEQVAAPALRLLGARAGATGVGICAEHLTTGMVRAWLHSLLARTPEPPTSRVVVACGPGELHELGSLLLTWRLRTAGRGALFVGANTPLPALMEARALPRASVLCLTATTMAAAWETTEALVTLDQGHAAPVRLAYAGPGFTAAAPLHARLEGHAIFLGLGIEEAVRCVCERLVEPHDQQTPAVD